jgi:hypothetical protein
MSLCNLLEWACTVAAALIVVAVVLVVLAIWAKARALRDEHRDWSE